MWFLLWLTFSLSSFRTKSNKNIFKIKTTENKNKKGRGRQKVNGAQGRTSMYTYVDHMHTRSDIHEH